MLNLVFSTVLFTGCPAPEVNVAEGLTWTKEDAKVITKAQDGCLRYYGEGSCLVRITKLGKLNYHAVCRKTN